MKKYFVIPFYFLTFFVFGCNFFYIDNWEPPKKYKTILKKEVRIKIGTAKTIRVFSPGNITFYNLDDNSRLGLTKDHFKMSYNLLKKKSK
ncbi:MAG: hypothetical protein H7A23_04765 [Leptospiraceae bacterium]|nr:hypothetical protein [Leptospiraceae bacterium]MCP5493847.1 hypothetical protein [Leptospiraceae bacterium]